LNDVIQTRYHAARQASLLQQMPGALIDAVEVRAMGTAHLQTSMIHGAPPIVATTGAGSIGPSTIMGLTGALVGTVVLVDSDYPTGGPAVVQSGAAASRTKPEWVSTADNKWTRWAETAKSVLRQAERDVGPATSAAARLRVDRLTAIQASLGLPTLVMADVLGITRQGLYKWLDAAKDITLQEVRRLRFDAVERIARAWKDRSVAPLAAAVREPLASGQTVYELLSANAIDEVAIVAALDELLAKLQGEPKSLSKKMAEAGFGRRPSRRAVPDDE